MKKAFTIIELGIVLAIVALCAMIVVPNFADSRSRTNNAKTRAVLRTAAVALEAYAADYSGNYPYDGYSSYGPLPSYNYWYLPRDLSTPVAYLQTHLIPDPYRVPTGSFPFDQYNNIRYINTDSTWGTMYDELWGGVPTASQYYPAMLHEFGRYRVSGCGPDGTYGPNGWPGVSTVPPYNYPAATLPLPYDPTNGLVSAGDIIRSQVCEFGYKNIAP